MSYTLSTPRRVRRVALETPNKMETLRFFETARTAVYVMIGICLLIGAIRFRRLQYEQRLLFYLICATAVVEAASTLLWKANMNNNFLFHIYAVTEFTLLAFIYRRPLDGLIKSIYMNALIVTFILFAIGNTLFFQSVRQFNSHVTFAEGLLLIILALMYFHKMLRDLEYRQLESNAMFWISTSVITYFSGALVLFHVANDLIPESLKVRGVVWGVHALFNVVHYVLYTIALYVKPGRTVPAVKSMSVK